jgi:hypothetical protein
MYPSLPLGPSVRKPRVAQPHLASLFTQGDPAPLTPPRFLSSRRTPTCFRRRSSPVAPRCQSATSS